MKFWQFVKASDAKKAIENVIAIYEKRLAEERKAREILEDIALSFDFTPAEKEFLFNDLRNMKLQCKTLEKNLAKNLLIDL